MVYYTGDDIDKLEENCKSSTYDLELALTILVRLLKQHSIVYAVTGGMNFCYRGSPRDTSDIDVAVDNSIPFGTILDIFNTNPDIYRPQSKLQWASSGVARLFVVVGRSRLVQIDLSAKGGEGYMITANLAHSVETLKLKSTKESVNFLSIGPLVRLKMKAYFEHNKENDYIDLLFVCKSEKYAPLVRNAASSFHNDWKEFLLEEVIEADPGYERYVRAALDMDRPLSGYENKKVIPPTEDNSRKMASSTPDRNKKVYPPPESKNRKITFAAEDKKPNPVTFAAEEKKPKVAFAAEEKKPKVAGPAKPSGEQNNGEGPSIRRALKNGDVSSDGYWTYSSQHTDWYHKHRNNEISWRSKSLPTQPSRQNNGEGPSIRRVPKNGDVSSDGYWTYSSQHMDWYHKHRNNEISWRSNLPTQPPRHNNSGHRVFLDSVKRWRHSEK